MDIGVPIIPVIMRFISVNMEWIFSGLGISIVSAIFPLLNYVNRSVENNISLSITLGGVDKTIKLDKNDIENTEKEIKNILEKFDISEKQKNTEISTGPTSR